jgi:hypothetical protein
MGSRGFASPLEVPPGSDGPAADEAFHVMSAYTSEDEFDLIHDHA